MQFDPAPTNAADSEPQPALLPDASVSVTTAAREEPAAPSVSLPRPRPLGLLWTVLVALIGGVFGIFGAFVGETQTGGLILLPILGAPIIEEALKPVGVYLLQARWPHLLLGRVHTAFLGALAGLTFGVIEALVYVYIYVPDPSDAFVTYRFTWPLVMHTFCSMLVGLGITRQVISWANGENRLPKSSRNLYIVAVAIHATYNTMAVILSLSGVVDFD